MGYFHVIWEPVTLWAPKACYGTDSDLNEDMNPPTRWKPCVGIEGNIFES